MRGVYQEFGQTDLDIVALFADSLMVWKPRKMFDSNTGKAIPSSPVAEVRSVLERGLQLPGVRGHAGVPHLYIHLMEMSDTPEVALVACDIIRDLVPDAGHMFHMPTHIDVLVGEYRRAMAYNYKATSPMTSTSRRTAASTSTASTGSTTTTRSSTPRCWRASPGWRSSRWTAWRPPSRGRC